MKKIRSLLTASLIALALAASPAHATNTSTINPANPAQGSALSSATLRANFLAAYNDINTIYGLIANIVTSGITSLTGDVTTGMPASGVATATVGRVNGVSYPASPSTNTVPVVTNSGTITYEAVPNSALGNSSITVAGHNIALGGTQTLSATDLTNGVIGSGAVVLATSPSLITPNLGVASGTSVVWSGTDSALNFTATGTGGDIIPVGTTGQRPSSAEGLFRDNTTTHALETYLNGAWQQIISTTSGIVSELNGGTGASTNIFTRMKALCETARLSNLAINSPNSTSIVTTQSSAPSFTGYTNIIPIQSGFVASFTGNITQGSAVITNVSSTTGLAANQPLAEQVSYTIPANVPYYAAIAPNGVNVGASTVTMTAQATGTATGITIDAASQLFTIGGGPVTTANNSQGNMAVGGATYSLAPVYHNPYSIDFITDGANFTATSQTTNVVWLKISNDNAATNYNVRVAVDNNYQTANPISMNPAGTTGFQTVYIGVALNTPGPHLIHIELPTEWLLQAFYKLNGTTISPPSRARQIKTLWVADSYGSSAAPQSWPERNVAYQTSYLMGWTPYLSTVGGTGYCATASGNGYNWASSQRIADYGRGQYDVGVFFGSINDSSCSLVTLQANALTAWQGFRAAQPTAPMFLYGVPTTGFVGSSTATNMEGALYSAYLQFNDANSVWIPITTDPDGAWFSSSNITFLNGGYMDYANFTGSTSGSVMTAATFTSGTVRVGQLCTGAGGLSETVQSIASGNGITNGSTFNMSGSTTVGSETITCGDYSHPSDPIGDTYLSLFMERKARNYLRLDTTY